LPFQNSWIPSYYTKLALPPIPSAFSATPGAWIEAEEQVDTMVAVGTDEWCEFKVDVRTRKARGCWVSVDSLKQGSEEEEEARKWWPQGDTWKPWSVGLWMEDADLLVEVGTKWKGSS
jgi:hypothetical protein